MLIEINPATRIPRTFKRFCGLMVQLLHKYSITASDSSVKLMKVIKNPITDHLPAGQKFVKLQFRGGNFVATFGLNHISFTGFLVLNRLNDAGLWIILYGENDDFY